MAAQALAALGAGGRGHLCAPLSGALAAYPALALGVWHPIRRALGSAYPARVERPRYSHAYQIGTTFAAVDPAIVRP